VIHPGFRSAILEINSSVISRDMGDWRTAQNLWMFESVVAKVRIIPTTNYGVDWCLSAVNEVDCSVCCRNRGSDRDDFLERRQ
jgi:hypothetical protein